MKINVVLKGHLHGKAFPHNFVTI